MDVEREMVPPCGLYCGACRIYQATQAGDVRLLGRLGRIYGRRLGEKRTLTAADLECDGCRSERISWFCRACSIRDCALEKGFEGCYACGKFPCGLIDEFPIPLGKQVIHRAVPFWREHGTEAWVQAEERRYVCPACEGRLYRGARHCPGCGVEIAVD